MKKSFPCLLVLGVGLMPAAYAMNWPFQSRTYVPRDTGPETRQSSLPTGEPTVQKLGQRWFRNWVNWLVGKTLSMPNTQPSGLEPLDEKLLNLQEPVTLEDLSIIPYHGKTLIPIDVSEIPSVTVPVAEQSNTFLGLTPAEWRKWRARQLREYQLRDMF